MPPLSRHYEQRKSEYSVNSSWISQRKYPQSRTHSGSSSRTGSVLLNQENEKGYPLTELEALEIRDNAAYIMMPVSLASEMA